MRAIERRKALRDLKRLCKDHGLEVSIDKDMGKGSHLGLIFRDPNTNEAVTIVIPGHKEISPGVQRDVLKYLAGLGIAVAGVVHEIIKVLFDK